MDLKEYIKKLDAIYTDTLRSIDFCRVGFALDKVKVDYTDTSSLYDLVNTFNKLYVMFKKEYEQLEKLNLGKAIEKIYFSKYDDDGVEQRLLVFYIDNPTICSHEWTKLYFIERNEKIETFVTNGLRTNKNYYRETISLFDDSIVKKYLDLFEKYNLLLELYYWLKNNFIFGDGCNCLFTRIDGDILTGLKSFNIVCGSSYFNCSYNIELNFILGEKFKIDYDNCKMEVDEFTEIMDKENTTQVLHNIHVHNKYLKREK